MCCYEGADHIKGDLSLRTLGPIVSHSLWLIHNSCAVSRILRTAPPFQQIVRGSISWKHNWNSDQCESRDIVLIIVTN